VVKNIALNRWAKRRLNNKINARKNEFICLQNTAARLKSKDLPPKKLVLATPLNAG